MHLYANAAGSVSGYLLIYVRLNLFIAHTHTHIRLSVRLKCNSHSRYIVRWREVFIYTYTTLGAKVIIRPWPVGVSFVFVWVDFACLFPVDKLQPIQNCADKWLFTRLCDGTTQPLI